MRVVAEKRNRKSWGAGCLALALLVGLVAVSLGGLLAFEATRDAEPTAIDLTQTLPPYEMSLGTEAVAPGRLILEIEGVDVAIQPGPPGSPLRVEGSIDMAGIELMPEYSEQGDRGWTYRLRARPSRLLGRLIHRGGGVNSIRITLPAATPISIEGVVSSVETRIELGGLWIVGTDLEFGTGSQHIAFTKPLQWPMERFEVDAPVGELTLVELGNASPRHVRIDKNLGEVCLDLAGPWRADTTIEIACGVGSCDLHRPGADDAVVRVAGVESDLPESDLPVIEVRMTGVLSDNVEISQQLPNPANSP